MQKGANKWKANKGNLIERATVVWTANSVEDVDNVYQRHTDFFDITLTSTSCAFKSSSFQFESAQHSKDRWTSQVSSLNQGWILKSMSSSKKVSSVALKPRSKDATIDHLQPQIQIEKRKETTPFSVFKSSQVKIPLSSQNTSWTAKIKWQHSTWTTSFWVS